MYVLHVLVELIVRGAAAFHTPYPSEQYDCRSQSRALYSTRQQPEYERSKQAIAGKRRTSCSGRGVFRLR
jgi:hypothetical protein